MVVTEAVTVKFPMYFEERATGFAHTSDVGYEERGASRLTLDYFWREQVKDVSPVYLDDYEEAGLRGLVSIPFRTCLVADACEICFRGKETQTQDAVVYTWDTSCGAYDVTRGGSVEK